MKLKPFFQGKLDVFCAIYAVLNGLRLTHGIRTSKGMAIFRDTLLNLSKHPKMFEAVVKQQTDYVALVDAILASQASQIKLDVVKPFSGEPMPDVDGFWQACDEWLNPGGEPAPNRAIITRFNRYLDAKKPPVIRHWTTIDSINPKSMRLFDSSHEAEAIQNLAKTDIVTLAREIDETHLLHMQPDTTRFLRLPY